MLRVIAEPGDRLNAYGTTHIYIFIRSDRSRSSVCSSTKVAIDSINSGEELQICKEHSQHGSTGWYHHNSPWTRAPTITTALQVSREISNLISEIKDAPHNVQARNFGTRKLYLDKSTKQTNVNNGKAVYPPAVNIPLKSCGDELGKLRNLLESLLSKSTKGGIRQLAFYEIEKFIVINESELCFGEQERHLSRMPVMTDIPGHQLVRRVSAFDPDRKIPGGGTDLDTGGMTQSPTFEKIISQTTERTMEKVQAEFLQRPDVRIEELLRLDLIETRQLWATNVQSENLGVCRSFLVSQYFVLKDITDTNAEIYSGWFGTETWR